MPRTNLGVTVAFLTASALGVWVVPPLIIEPFRALSETTQALGYFAGWAVMIWVIGSGAGTRR